jgi:hypothetical protein
MASPGYLRVLGEQFRSHADLATYFRVAAVAGSLTAAAQYP